MSHRCIPVKTCSGVHSGSACAARAVCGGRGISVAATQHLDDAEDAELVAAIGRGDDAAMAVIMRRHREPVVAFAAPARG